ncbi:MAG: hypothetical protein WC781_05395 [Candidatus Pacearchaeota archaeon]|jgi:hypothetical protein
MGHEVVASVFDIVHPNISGLINFVNASGYVFDKLVIVSIAILLLILAIKLIISFSDVKSRQQVFTAMGALVVLLIFYFTVPMILSII